MYARRGAARTSQRSYIEKIAAMLLILSPRVKIPRIPTQFSPFSKYFSLVFPEVVLRSKFPPFDDLPLCASPWLTFMSSVHSEESNKARAKVSPASGLIEGENIL